MAKKPQNLWAQKAGQLPDRSAKPVIVTCPKHDIRFDKRCGCRYCKDEQESQQTETTNG